MAASPLSLYIDTQARKLVSGTNNAAEFTLPTFTQGDIMPARLYFLDRTTTFATPYTGADFNGHSIRVGIEGGSGGTPTGTAGSTTPIVLTTSWTWVAGTFGYFSGTLNLNTAGVAAFIGAAASANSTFEIEVTDGSSNVSTYVQVPVTIRAEVLESGSAAPVGGDPGLTLSQGNALYVLKLGLPGQVIIFTSENGAWRRTFGVNNDGSPMDDITAL